MPMKSMVGADPLPSLPPRRRPPGGGVAASRGPVALLVEHGHLSEGERWLRQALAAADGPPVARAPCGAGMVAHDHGRYEEAAESVAKRRRVRGARVTCLGRRWR